MRAVVTGATSFIGSNVVSQLLGQGLEVCAVIRPGSAGKGRITAMQEEFGGLQITECELSEMNSLAGRLGTVNCWMHLGWDGSGSDNRRKPEIQSANADYALDALETAAAAGCRRFLFCGSQAEYGIRSTLMREEDICHPLSEYGKAKARVCREAGKRAEELGIQYIHTRIFSVYGPGDHPWSLVKSCLRSFQAGEKMELGECTQLWNYLYITDAVQALTALLIGEAPAGIYNVAGEDTRPLRSYIEEMYRLCGQKGSCVYGVRQPNAEGVTSLNPDITRLKEAIGFCQRISFEEGIRSMLD